MFDTLTVQEVYEYFMKQFKQQNTDSVTTFYIKYSKQVQKLISRSVWSDDHTLQFHEVTHFRAKLKPDLSLQTTLFLQQSGRDDTSLALESCYATALLAEKHSLLKMSSLPAVAFEPQLYTRPKLTCFYCDRPGHAIKDCKQKKNHKKPCQKYIESGKARFGAEYEWDSRKREGDQARTAHAVLAQHQPSTDNAPSVTVMAVQQPDETTNKRTVAMINMDIKTDDGNWYNDIPTLIDSCGCENGINSEFAHLHGFQILQDESPQAQVTAVSATGGIIQFNQYIEAEVQLGTTYTKIRFYLMEDLPRNLLLGFPWFEATGAILDAKQGKLTIQQFGETIPLFRMQNSNLHNAIFSPILPVGQLTHPIPLLHFSSQHMLIPPQHSANQPPGSPNGELLENVFALTQPRQRSSQFDNKISEIQQQPFVDDLPTTSYERQLHQLLQQFEDIFDTECVEPANVPEIHVDLKPEF